MSANAHYQRSSAAGLQPRWLTSPTIPIAANKNVPHELDAFLGHNTSAALRGVVVVAPHPDDEILGCGALMSAIAAQGGLVWVVYLTDGGASQPDLDPVARRNLVLRRQGEAWRGLNVLGVDPLCTVFVGAPDGELHRSHTHQSLAAYKLDELLELGWVSAVFVTSPHDNHIDHKAAYRLVEETVRPYSNIGLYTYPVSSRIDAESNIDLHSAFPITFRTNGFERAKREALACHTSQLEGTAQAGGFALRDEQVAMMCAGPEYFARDQRHGT
jgi:LmbE family N-acetylglucosaminyl deacetylase